MRGWCASVIIALLCLTGAAAAAGDVPLNHAGIVVRHGDGRLTYAYVAFVEETISGLELLRRSTIPLVTVSFGGLGDGVCSLEGEGCGAGECRRRVCQGPREDDPYWQYFRQDGTGAWRWLVLGPSATGVGDGDVDGWSWTGSDPGLPSVGLADVARLAGAGAATAGDDGPPAAVRTVFPPNGLDLPAARQQGWPVYLAGVTILVGVAGGGVVIARRARSHRLETGA